MKKISLIFASILLAVVARTEEPLDLDFLDDPFAEMDEPPVLQDPRKPIEVKKPKLEFVDEYCLCKCFMKGVSPAKARWFRGKKSGHGCLCECAVKK